MKAKLAALWLLACYIAGCIASWPVVFIVTLFVGAVCSAVFCFIYLFDPSLGSNYKKVFSK